MSWISEDTVMDRKSLLTFIVIYCIAAGAALFFLTN